MVNGMAQENKEVKEEKNGNEASEETKVSEELFRIPKNIRQIGKEESKRKLYIEDYVLNLMKQLSKRSSMEYQMAVLLGQAVHSDGILYIFVKGAVEVHKLSLDANDNFTGDTWSGIYSQIKQHFHDVDIVGWFLTKPGLKESPDLRLTRIHERNFQDRKSEEEKGNGKNRCLLLYDSIENRENYFIYDHNRFKKAHGYYIYYERNQDMQEYLISHSSNLSIENGFEDLAVRKIRQAMQRDAGSDKKEGGGEVKGRREIVVLNKSNSKKENENADTGNGVRNGSVKARAAIIALFIMFFCIMAAKTNLGESWNVWNNSGVKSQDDVSGNEGTNKDGSSEGWILNEKEDGSEEKEENQDEVTAPVGLPEMDIISNAENPGDDEASEDEDKSSGENGETDKEDESDKEEGESGESGESAKEDESDVEEGESGESGESAKEDESDVEEGESGESGESAKEDESDLEEGESGESGKEDESSGDSGESEETGNDDGNNTRYYIVKEGDTLASISLKEYHTILKAAQIQELNDIEDPDLIYTGQTLIIP